MPYNSAPYHRRPPRRRREPAPPPVPLPDELRQEFADRPFLGASFGEVTAPRRADPPPPAPAPFRPDPPPWVGEPEVLPPPEPEPLPVWQQAREELVKAMLEAGDVEELRPPGPPAELEPLRRPTIPEPPDWHQEEERAIRQNERERLEHARKLVDEAGRGEPGLAEERPAKHPPPRREQP